MVLIRIEQRLLKLTLNLKALILGNGCLAHDILNKVFSQKLRLLNTLQFTLVSAIEDGKINSILTVRPGVYKFPVELFKLSVLSSSLSAPLFVVQHWLIGFMRLS